MAHLDIIYLVLLFGLFVLINLTYKKFPKNHDRLYKILTDDK